MEWWRHWKTTATLWFGQWLSKRRGLLGCWATTELADWLSLVLEKTRCACWAKACYTCCAKAGCACLARTGCACWSRGNCSCCAEGQLNRLLCWRLIAPALKADSCCCARGWFLLLCEGGLHLGEGRLLLLKISVYNSGGTRNEASTLCKRRPKRFWDTTNVYTIAVVARNTLWSGSGQVQWLLYTPVALGRASQW